jgi:hypothetical protein
MVHVWLGADIILHNDITTEDDMSDGCEFIWQHVWPLTDDMIFTAERCDRQTGHAHKAFSFMLNRKENLQTEYELNWTPNPQIYQLQ